MSKIDFQEFAAEAARNPLAQIARYKEKNRRLMGFLCSYVPEELVYAAGFIPLRLLGRATQISLADKHLQAYCCSQVRAFMEDYLQNEYKDLEGVLFAQTCDTMQSFYDIFKKNFPDMFSFNFNFPCKVSGDAAFKYARAELARVRAELEKFAGKPIGRDELNNAVRVYNRNRDLLDRLYMAHAANPDKIPSVTLLHAVMASMFMDKKDINKLLEEFVNRFSANGGPAAGRKKLMLVGSVNVNEDVYNAADEYGAMIVDDDICTGRRYFDGKVEAPNDEALLRRYFDRAHCPAKHRDLTSRGRYLVELAKKSQADGVVFLYLKFCDPHAFDYPYMKDMLDKAGIRSLHMEIEQSSAPSGQTRTKLQAFIETL